MLGPVLQGLDLEYLTQVFELIGLPEVTDTTLTGVLALIGLNLADPLNVSGLDVPGLNVVTAGPTFAVLKMLGIDLGWVPTQPNSVANEINNSEYLKLGADGVLDLIFEKLDQTGAGVLGPILSTLGLGSLTSILGDLTELINEIREPVTGLVPDLLHARVTPTVGIGVGAFAAAMAYQQVIADLANQPGGSNYEQLTGELNPLLGSLSILPMLLINNPGRPDGGMFARFGPLAALLGIDTVNPRTELTGDGGLLGDSDLLGYHLGGANVLPILIDATYEYQPLSDFAAWPNPVTLANNLAAALLPTYMLRGLSLEGLGDEIVDQTLDAVGNVGEGNPLALNIYLTLNSATLPVLEPLYLAADVLNIVGLSPLAQIPMRIANALAPALGILTDVGYGNVTRNPDGTYTRDFTNAGDEVPFLSFPNLNPLQVLADTFTALVGGIQKELGPNPTPGTPNALKTLLDAILGGNLGGLLGAGGTGTGGTGTGTGGTSTGNPLTDLLNNVLGSGGLGGLLGGLFGGGLLGQQSITSVPDANARMVSLAAEVPAEEAAAAEAPAADSEKDALTSELSAEDSTSADVDAEQAAAEKTEAEQADAEQAADEQAADEKAEAEKEAADKAAAEEAEAPTGPKHAKPDTDDDASPSTDTDTTTTPKHAKPGQQVIRDSSNFSPKPADKTEAGGSDNDSAPAADAAASEESDAGAAAA